MRRVILLAVLSAGAIFAAGGDLRLIQAAKKSDVKAVRSLLLQKASVIAVEADGATALDWATQQDNLEIVDLLLQAGAEELTWMTDVPKAVEKAKAEKKLVMLDFTGSDWCGWCIKPDASATRQPF